MLAARRSRLRTGKQFYMSQRLIFRWSYKHPKTGKVVRAKRRPFPMLIDDDTGEMTFAEKKTAPAKAL